jgi:hypothetical protein
MPHKLLVLELDSATWAVADRLIAAGQLPHLARVKREGAWGILRSLEPMLSPALWTTIYTGKTAAEHGIESFGSTARSLRCRRLWDILDQAGLSVGVMGTLATWPPQPLSHGFLVPDYITALNDHTWPPHLSHLQQVMLDARLRRGNLWRYLGLTRRLLQTGVHPARLIRSGLLLLRDLAGAPPLSVMWRKILTVEAVRADAFVHLYRRHRPRFAACHYHAIDALGHFYWRYYEPDALTFSTPERDVRRYQGVVPQAYIQADELLGRFLNLMDRETTLLVLSDHGQAAHSHAPPQSSLDLLTLIEFLGLQHEVTPLRIADHHYLHFQNPDRLPRTEELLRDAFITTPERPVFHEISRTDQRLCFKLVPGVWAGDQDEHIVFPEHGELSMRALQMRVGPPITSLHTLDGLVALYGHDVRPGQTLDAASILDVTPTALALFGLPLARDMTGRVWWEALDLDRARVERYVDSYENVPLPHDTPPTPLTPEEQALLLDRLRDLGYL